MLFIICHDEMQRGFSEPSWPTARVAVAPILGKRKMRREKFKATLKPKYTLISVQDHFGILWAGPVYSSANTIGQPSTPSPDILSSL